MFYNFLLNTRNVLWIDKVEIAIETKKMSENCPILYGAFNVPIQGKKDKAFQFQLSKEYAFPNVLVKVGFSGRRQFLYLTVLSVPIHGTIRYLFIEALIKLLSLGILGNRRSSPDGLRREASRLLKLFSINLIELRTDVHCDNGGGRLVDLLGKYRTDGGLLKLSSWEKRYEKGYLLKCYTREDFTRIELVLYGKALKEFGHALLSTPENVLELLSVPSERIIDNLCSKKPGLSVIRRYLSDSSTLKARVKTLGLGSLADTMMNLGQASNIF